MARRRFDALAVGDAILDIVTPPLPGGKGDRQSRVRGFAYLPGGNATNFALAFGALGGRARFVGCIGGDWAGDALRAAYRKAGVDARLRVSRSKVSGTTVAVTSSDASRHLITAIGANEDLRLHDVPAAWISSAGHLHRAGYWWTTGLIGSATARLLARARRSGAGTSLDTASDPEGWPRARRESVLAVLPHLDVYFGTEEEICGVAGMPSLASAADVLLQRGVGEVVVHQGRRGSSLFTSAKTETARAFRVSPMNPTGCGDVFNAAYIFASMAGEKGKARLRFANAAAAWHLENLAKPYPTGGDLLRRFGIRP